MIAGQGIVRTGALEPVPVWERVGNACREAIEGMAAGEVEGAAGGGRRSKQGRVWEDISFKMAALGSRSATQAVEQVYQDHRASLNDFVKRMRARPGQVGAVFAIGGRVAGAELFDVDDYGTAVVIGDGTTFSAYAEVTGAAKVGEGRDQVQRRRRAQFGGGPLHLPAKRTFG